MISQGNSFCPHPFSAPWLTEAMPRGASDDKQAKNGGLAMSEPEISLLSSFIRDLAHCVPGLPWLFIHAGDDGQPCLNSITVLARAAFRAGNHSLYPHLIFRSEICAVALSAVRAS